MSFASSLLDSVGRTLSVEEDQMLKWSAASLYGGGSDTVGPSLQMKPS